MSAQTTSGEAWLEYGDMCESVGCWQWYDWAVLAMFLAMMTLAILAGVHQSPAKAEATQQWSGLVAVELFTVLHRDHQCGYWVA